jgi:hypothetical protein
LRRHQSVTCIGLQDSEISNCINAAPPGLTRHQRGVQLG